VYERERLRENISVCMRVSERGKGRKIESECMYVCVCACVYMCVKSFVFFDRIRKKQEKVKLQI